MVAKVAFIGLGVMGAPMAGHLARAGIAVTVFNRTTPKAEQWLAQHRGQLASSARAAAMDADCVITCVGDDDDLRAVVLGEDGALAGLRPGSVIVDHTTTSQTVAVEIAERCTQRGVDFIDAPVSGGQKGAEQGRLSVMCGGSAAVFARVRPVISHYAVACELMGATGSGQLTKMVNQICIAGLLQALAEGLNFGVRAGLEMDKVVAIISQGAAQSWQLDNRAATMLAGEFDFGFAVDWMRKDLGIAMAAATANGASLPVTAMVDEFYADIQANGLNLADTSSLITRLN